jgi:S-adenosylmethionine/arginine decarboxylase-like enzyme
MTRPFGKHLLADFSGCDPSLIRDGDALKTFIREMCQVIGMTAHGDPWAERFALHDPIAGGYTVIQPITTSLISLHASEGYDGLCLDVFSCAPFDAARVVKFAGTHLGGHGTQELVIARGMNWPNRRAGTPRTRAGWLR